MAGRRRFCAVRGSMDIALGWLRGRRSDVGGSWQSSLPYVVRDGRAAPRDLQFWEALIGFRGDGGTSHDQSRDEGAKESFASAPGVMHELEEAEIQRQLLLRDTPVWPQPGT